MPKHVATPCLDAFYACIEYVIEASRAKGRSASLMAHMGGSMKGHYDERALLYQVKQFLRLIERYNLQMEDEP
jgi:hypothetical protein